MPASKPLFAGSPLGAQRAARIAADAGFTLIDLHPCTREPGECALLAVQGTDGRVVVYEINASRCPPSSDRRHRDRSGPRRKRPPGDPTSCFGGFTVEREIGASRDRSRSTNSTAKLSGRPGEDGRRPDPQHDAQADAINEIIESLGDGKYDGNYDQFWLDLESIQSWSSPGWIEPDDLDPVNTDNVLVRMPVDWGNSDYPKIRWNDVEGKRHFLKPEYGRALVITACEEHFGAGTQGRANLDEAVHKINRISGVDLAITIEEGPHLSASGRGASDLYASPPNTSHPNEHMRVEMTDSNPDGSTMTATASAYHYFEDFNGEPDWKWGGRGQPTPRKSDYVVIAVQSNRSQGYADYDANPGGEVAKAPPIWVLSHELGHAFHFSHDNDRQFTGVLERPLAQRLFLGLAPFRGGTIDHGGNINTGGVSALSKALLRHYYPTASPAPRDARPQWYNHEILVVEDPIEPGEITGLGFPDYNPSQLRHDPETDLYNDCATGKRPVYRMQYSDASDRACSEVHESEVRIAFTFDGSHLASRTHENQDCEVDFIQYDWQRRLSIHGSRVGVPPAGGSLEIVVCGMVDPGNSIPEYDEADNERCMPVTLLAAGAATAECPGE